MEFEDFPGCNLTPLAEEESTDAACALITSTGSVTMTFRNNGEIETISQAQQES